ncbi:MAG: hypothetical protein UR98_C0001G0010 [Parcubacteria group bacterium GW2011_GWA1_36_12]|nr:MAG: hypothetical protein UR98_C0001G0010 [Parcubacteria group bacterium GW2011_GWA1_36_12]
MSERQLIPQVFLEAFEDDHVLAEFCTWSDDFVKSLVLPSSDSPEDSNRADSKEEAYDNYALMYRLKELKDRASRLGILNEVVEYAQVFFESKGEQAPMSLARVIVRDPSLADAVINLGTDFLRVGLKIAESNINIREIGAFVPSAQNN